MWDRILNFSTSLRLTVALLALGIAVVFFGTLAQTSDGLYIAQQKYFRSWFSTWSPLDDRFRWIVIPLPGGYLLGTMLLANLVAAHVKRFKFAWKKSGILLTHVGVILLLVGQLATDLFARESRMSFAEGEAKNYSEDFQAYELAFLGETSDPQSDQVIAFPESIIKTHRELRHEKLPFVVRVQEWMPNSEANFRAPQSAPGPARATHGTGLSFDFVPVPITGKMDDKNVPTVIAEIEDLSGAKLGTWCFSGWSGDGVMSKEKARRWARDFGSDDLAAKLYSRLVAPQRAGANKGEFRVVLRPVRYYEPFALQLVKTTHEVYSGTDIPKNYQSRVRIDNPAAGESREVDIYMNNPLRYRGLTFFQLQMGSEEADESIRGTSVLQVVANPSWLTPYAACGLVGAGLAVQFLIHLSGFIQKRAGQAAGRRETKKRA